MLEIPARLPEGYILLILGSPSRFPVPEPTENPAKDVGTDNPEDSASFLLQWEQQVDAAWRKTKQNQTKNISSYSAMGFLRQQSQRTGSAL